MDYLNYKDRQLLSEAYNTILEKKKDFKEKKKDVNNDGKIDKSDDYLANRRKIIAQAIAKKESKKNFKDTLKETYETLFESNFLNKKFARRYNKITSALLKAEPGSKEYNQLKMERDDLVNILKDHGMSAKDLEKLLTKKENDTKEEETHFSPNTNLQYPDSEDSDVKDLNFSVDKNEK
jgi:hypothetical protein